MFHLRCNILVVWPATAVLQCNRKLEFTKNSYYTFQEAKNKCVVQNARMQKLVDATVISI